MTLHKKIILNMFGFRIGVLNTNMWSCPKSQINLISGLNSSATSARKLPQGRKSSPITSLNKSLKSQIKTWQLICAISAPPASPSWRSVTNTWAWSTTSCLVSARWTPSTAWPATPWSWRARGLCDNYFAKIGLALKLIKQNQIPLASISQYQRPQGLYIFQYREGLNTWLVW